QFAQGLAPDFLSSLHLVARCPILMAPAMNGKMWAHPATVANVATLRERGVHFIGPEEGMLACGYEGIGRMWPVEGILERIETLLTQD
ncbi:MAG: flavoprotein, partial [Verrucomicrobiia bacterium]